MGIRAFFFSTYQGAWSIGFVRRLRSGGARTNYPAACCSYSGCLYSGRSRDAYVRCSFTYERRSNRRYTWRAAGAVCKTYACKIICFRRFISRICQRCRCGPASNAGRCDSYYQCAVASNYSACRSNGSAIRYG